MTNRAIFCCCCENDIHARLTDGREIYPHRHDLYSLPFWRCDGCGNHVGCHHKTKDRTRPLGVIPTPEITRARQHIHRVLDPIWKSGGMPRGAVSETRGSDRGVMIQGMTLKNGGLLLDKAQEDDLVSFFPTRHANQRYGGNVSPGCSRQCVDVVGFTA